MELTREYTRNSDGLTFVRFGNDHALYCDDDDTGANDIPRITDQEIADNFTFKRKYWED